MLGPWLCFYTCSQVSRQLSPEFCCFLEGNRGSAFVHMLLWVFFPPGQATRCCSFLSLTNVNVCTARYQHQDTDKNACLQLQVLQASLKSSGLKG